MQDLSIWHLAFAVAAFVILAWIIGWRIVLATQAITRGDGAHHDVMQLLEQAAQEMAAHSPGQEADEIAYLLESLGRRVDENTYRQMLEAVRRDVAARLLAPKPPSLKGYRTASPRSVLR